MRIDRQQLIIDVVNGAAHELSQKRLLVARRLSLAAQLADVALWLREDFPKEKSTYIQPVDYPISGKYGYDPSYPGNDQHVHYGVDYACPSGTTVRTVYGGEVIAAGVMPQGVAGVQDGAWGLTVRVLLESGPVVDYCHLSQSGVSVGNKISAGSLIGLSGDTGLTTGPHLHLQVWPGLASTSHGANRVDPEAWLGWV